MSRSQKLFNLFLTLWLVSFALFAVFFAKDTFRFIKTKLRLDVQTPILEIAESVKGVIESVRSEDEIVVTVNKPAMASGGFEMPEPLPAVESNNIPQVIIATEEAEVPTLPPEKLVAFELLSEVGGEMFAYSAIQSQGDCNVIIDKLDFEELANNTGLGNAVWQLAGGFIILPFDGGFLARSIDVEANGENSVCIANLTDIAVVYPEGTWIIDGPGGGIIERIPQWSPSMEKDGLYEIAYQQVFLRPILKPFPPAAERTEEPPKPSTIGIFQLGGYMRINNITSLTADCPAEPLLGTVETREGTVVDFGQDAGAYYNYSKTACLEKGFLEFILQDPGIEGYLEYMGSVWVGPMSKPQVYDPTPEPVSIPTLDSNAPIQISALAQKMTEMDIDVLETECVNGEINGWPSAVVSYYSLSGYFTIDFSEISTKRVEDYICEGSGAVQAQTIWVRIAEPLYQDQGPWLSIFGLYIAPFR